MQGEEQNPAPLPDGKLETQAVLWLLDSLCNLHRIPFDARLVAQDYPPPYDLATLIDAARSLGFQAALSNREGLDWAVAPLPAVAFLNAAPVVPEAPGVVPAEESVESPQPVLQPVLIVKASDDALFYFRPGGQAPETLPMAEIDANLVPQLLFVARPASAGTSADDPDAVEQKKEFSFHWFIPELLKHKKLWRDVLLASLAIQLVGLATPLFTQVIIDKVVVHQTKSTLWVLGIALIMFMLFTSGMTWLRQYLVLHTGNRIDAVLGSEVFRHLLRLPLPYFEHRPTGTLIARLHGVETIREFITGTAVSLCLDLPFLLIFLAVMFSYSWQLSLIAVGLLGLIAFLSFLVAPVFRDKLNQQFLHGARQQAFLTEYVAGMSTIKSLQMEADVDKKYSDLFAQCNRSLSGVLCPPAPTRNNPSHMHQGGAGSDQGDSDQQQVAAA